MNESYSAEMLKKLIILWYDEKIIDSWNKKRIMMRLI